jgi:Sugar fermentation stimulation protein RE domain
MQAVTRAMLDSQPAVEGGGALGVSATSRNKKRLAQKLSAATARPAKSAKQNAGVSKVPKTRCDFMLTHSDDSLTFVEVKSVTLAEGGSCPAIKQTRSDQTSLCCLSGLVWSDLLLQCLSLQWCSEDSTFFLSITWLRPHEDQALHCAVVNIVVAILQIPVAAQ